MVLAEINMPNMITDEDNRGQITFLIPGILRMSDAAE